ncbi:hypothetical protein EDB81DRAFT_860533 [Dactylonectria macrodidyma]|uniref:Monooxygenase n=1 Tax=Dactylonectria macrodidyma TaxID=307937 RepID=A0A9P9IMI0_9HYPO|nr:hypothetical protein EDB81DRAFT_860533 [Dactylonectria macrodidyma]
MSSHHHLENPLLHPFLFLYGLLQWLTDKLLSPKAPQPNTKLHRPNIAVIGAGITGITSAAHCVGHGFETTIFESGSEDAVGGIWTRVNDTSGLQIHSLMYRFHPSVQWNRGYPNRQEIVSQVQQLWKRYGLQKRTRFNTKISRVYQENGKWVVNHPSLGKFDGLIVAIGTCGGPKIPSMQGMDKFKGEIYHSSELTGKDAKDKRIAVIGGGASAVEALEFASSEEAAKTTILSRSDKWIIPRNLIVDVLLSYNILGQETIFSKIPEFLLRKLFYRDIENVAPANKGIFTDTPMVNSDVMDMLREGKAEWVRCDIEEFVEEGVVVNRRAKGVPKGGPGHHEVIEADIVVMATGFKRPSLSFLPDDCFKDPYQPPNWYLQTFPPEHPSISAINCTYLSAIGTVGNWHIGIYTRILLMFLVDPLTRPRPFWMERWIDMTSFLKMNSPTGAFDFFTYLELLWWFVFCVAINPFRWKWALFVFFGFAFALPNAVTVREQRIMESKSRSKDDAFSL